MEPGFLSIANNNFTHIPRSVLENPKLVFLNMNGNPVRELPVRSPKGKYLSSLYIIGTLITQLPSWVDIYSLDFELLAGSTPLCEALHVRDATALGVDSPEELVM
jgi:Leucine-rich repeat (LRR) protein